MYALLLTLTSILASVILTLIGIRYSSKYHIKKKGRAKEKYVVTEKISHGEKQGYIDSARIVLVKSSENNAMGFWDVSLTSHPEDIIVDRYSFIHSYIHNMFAPGTILLNKKKHWRENTPSNKFNDYEVISKKLNIMPYDKIHKKIRKHIKKCRAVESVFNFPNTYTGPRYKRRLLIIAQNIGIVYSETEYVNRDLDVYTLIKYNVKKPNNYWLPVGNIGNEWEYLIHYEFGKNKLNVNT